MIKHNQDMTKRKIIPKLVEYGAYATLGTVGVALIVMASIERNTTFLRSHPWEFTIETWMVAILTSLPIIAMAWTRPKGSFKRALIAATALAIKMGVIHILLELSGFYKQVGF